MYGVTAGGRGAVRLKYSGSFSMTGGTTDDIAPFRSGDCRRCVGACMAGSSGTGIGSAVPAGWVCQRRNIDIGGVGPSVAHAMIDIAAAAAAQMTVRAGYATYSSVIWMAAFVTADRYAVASSVAMTAGAVTDNRGIVLHMTGAAIGRRPGSRVRSCRVHIGMTAGRVRTGDGMANAGSGVSGHKVAIL